MRRIRRDVEAQLFYALSLLGLNEGDRDVPTYLRAYAIARRVFRAHPGHPGAAHYVIHAVDDPAHASLGLDAARAYSRIAPDAGHAQHMTSHIFIALGMWDDVIDANVRAQNPPHAHARRNFGHGVQWLAYALLQEGRFAEGAGWVDSMRVQTERYASDPKVARSDVDESRSYLVLDRAAYVADTRAWRSPLAALDIDTTGLGVRALAVNDFALGAAALGRGEGARADSMLARVRSRNARARAGAEEGEEPASEIGYARVIEKTLGAMVLHARGDGAAAVAMLAEGAALDDSLPFAFGPPVEIVSPHEVAGEYLLELGKAKEAKREYMLALGRAPGRTAALIGLAAAELALGERVEARREYAVAAKNLARGDSAARVPLTKLRARLDASAGAKYTLGLR